MENKFENWDNYKKRITNPITKGGKVILSLYSKPDYEPRGYVIADKKKVAKVSGQLEKFYNVWNETDKLPF
jgi:hypothetical protein